VIHVRFGGVDDAPPVALDPSAGPISAALAARGIADLVEAGRWLQALPYGRNQRHDPLACVRDGHGTCTTKHATFVTCAHELGADVHLMWGVYRLDSSVSGEIASLLDEAGLRFVPSIHCFLRIGASRFIDLTEGNCNGKDRQITDYIDVVPALVGDDEGPVRRRVALDLIAHDPSFASMDPFAITALASRCHDAMNLACRAPVHRPIDVGSEPDRG
jgi:hypothetical protein